MHGVSCKRWRAAYWCAMAPAVASMHAQSRAAGAAGGGVIGADESRLLVRTGGRTERAQVSEGTGNGSSVCGHGVRAGGGVGKDVRPGRRLMRFAHLFFLSSACFLPRAHLRAVWCLFSPVCSAVGRCRLKRRTLRWAVPSFTLRAPVQPTSSSCTTVSTSSERTLEVAWATGNSPAGPWSEGRGPWGLGEHGACALEK